MNQASKDKTAFFSPHMGATNAHAAGITMVSKMEIKWDKLYESQDVRKEKKLSGNGSNRKWKRQQRKRSAKKQRPKSTQIRRSCHSLNQRARHSNQYSKDPLRWTPDFAHTVTSHLAILFHLQGRNLTASYQVTIKLRKTRFFLARAEFVGVDIKKEGNSPAESKYNVLGGIERPMQYTDLRILIGFIQIF